MLIAPQTKSLELTDTINAILHAGKYASETDWIWRKIKRECENIRSVEPADGWALLGSLYSVAGNVAEAQRSFGAAIALELHPTIYTNWMGNLGNLGLYVQAYELFALHGSPVNGEFTQRFVIGLQAGAFQKLTEFIDSAEKMGLDMTTLNISQVKNVAAFLRNAGVTDHDVARQLEAAGAVLRRNKLFSIGAPEISICDITEDFTGVTFALRLQCEAADIFSYNIQLAKEELLMDVKKNQAFDVVFI